MKMANLFGNADQQKSAFLKLNNAGDFPIYQFHLTGSVLAGPPMPGILACTTPRPVVVPLHRDGAGVVENQLAFDASAAEVAAWGTANYKLYYYLISTVGAEVMPLITGIPAGESTRVWQTIMNHFQGSIADTAGNVTKLIHMRMTGSLMTHVDAITQAGRLLTANIVAMTARNVAAVGDNAAAHVYIIQKLIQIAVLLSTAAALPAMCVDPVAQTRPDLCNSSSSPD
jgi:hypothetical protein